MGLDEVKFAVRRADETGDERERHHCLAARWTRSYSSSDGDQQLTRRRARALAAAVASGEAKGASRSTFAMTFLSLTDNDQLGVIGRRGGVDPDQNLRLVTLPLLHAELTAQGQVDGGRVARRSACRRGRRWAGFCTSVANSRSARQRGAGVRARDIGAAPTSRPLHGSH